MTAIDERPAQTVPDVPRCSVIVPVSGLAGPIGFLVPFGMVPCRLPAAGYFAGKCPCGHVRDGWLCEPHAELAADGGCRACLELEAGAHDCPLPVSRVTTGGAS